MSDEEKKKKPRLPHRMVAAERIARPNFEPDTVPPNPYGRKGSNPVVHELKKHSKHQLMSAIADILPMSVKDVKKLAKSKDEPACRALIAAVIDKGIETGSAYHAQFFMSYTFGRPIEYDPREDEFLEEGFTSAKQVPKEVLVGILQGLQNNAQPKPALVSAPA